MIQKVCNVLDLILPYFLKLLEQFEWRSRSNFTNREQHSILGWLEHSTPLLLAASSYGRLKGKEINV